MLSSELKAKMLELFEELDVPAPGVGWWKLCSDKKLIEYYERYVRGLTMCEGCTCRKKQLRKEIDEQIFEDIILGNKSGEDSNGQAK